jgi:hypothetical protein
MISIAPSFKVLPFCIYHYHQPDNLLGTIDNATMLPNKHFFCASPPVEFGSKWQFYKNFYAISPTIRPLPPGMNLISMTIKQSFPYNLSSVDHIPDPFNIPKKSLILITYTQPVLNTIPLYFFYPKSSTGIVDKNNLFPTFQDLSGDPNWENNYLPVIYVLDPTKFPKKDKYGVPLFRFKNIQGRCMPHPDGEEFCVLGIRNKGDTNLQTLVNLLGEGEEKEKYIKSKSHGIWIIIILLIFLLIFMSISIFIIYKGG